VNIAVNPPLNQDVGSTFDLPLCLKLITPTGYQILEHLAAVALRQRAIARASKRGWQRGWTYLRPTQHVKLASIRTLIRYGLVTPCCQGHNGNDLIKITRKGVELLELVRGEEILCE
jgi:hypothetical protein